MGVPFLFPKRFLDLRIDRLGRCNLRCKMCYYRYQEQPYPVLPVEKWYWIAREFFPRCRTVRFGNCAEPLLDPDLPELLGKAVEYRVPEIRFVTNATLLDEEKSRLLVKSRVFTITISMDAASEPLFSELRCGAKLDQLIANLETLVHVRKTLGSNLPKIQFNFVIMRSNLSQLPDFIRLVSRFRPSEINAYFAHLETGCPHEEEIIDATHPDFPAVADEAAVRAHEAGLHLHLPYKVNGSTAHSSSLTPKRLMWSIGRISSKMRNQPLRAAISALRMFTHFAVFEKGSLCWYPSFLLMIQPDLRMIPCCAWGTEPMGPIEEGMTFEEIWNLPEMSSLRRSLRTHQNIPHNCIGCMEATSRKVL